MGANPAPSMQPQLPTVPPPECSCLCCSPRTLARPFGSGVRWRSCLRLFLLEEILGCPHCGIYLQVRVEILFQEIFWALNLVLRSGRSYDGTQHCENKKPLSCSHRPFYTVHILMVHVLMVYIVWSDSYDL